ncbi:hypothetical protein BKA62DRAFT_674796 [Auriculariales sp. MPI-PUGE-AT-0066]|nr:hypothetical protein BKA62DRAFT_674796 [Auriculariales sp. MPI-PUGE-AT-0066]
MLSCNLVPIFLDLPLVCIAPGEVYSAHTSAALTAAVWAVRLRFWHHIPFDAAQIVGTLNSCTNLRCISFDLFLSDLLLLLRQSCSLDEAAWTHSAEVLVRDSGIINMSINDQMAVFSGLSGMRHLQCDSDHSKSSDREPQGVAQLLPYTDRLIHLDIGAKTWLALSALEERNVNSVRKITLHGFRDHGQGERRYVSRSTVVAAYERRTVEAIRTALPALNSLKTVTRPLMGRNAAQTDILVLLAGLHSVRTLELGFPTGKSTGMDAVRTVLGGATKNLRTLRLVVFRPADRSIHFALCIADILQSVFDTGGLPGLRELYLSIPAYRFGNRPILDDKEGSLLKEQCARRRVAVHIRRI